MKHFNYLSGSLLHPSYYILRFVFIRVWGMIVISSYIFDNVVVLAEHNRLEHIQNSLPSFPFLIVKYLYPPISIFFIFVCSKKVPFHHKLSKQC